MPEKGGDDHRHAIRNQSGIQHRSSRGYDGVYDLACQNHNFARFIQESLNRHVKGDWGDVDDEDKQTNGQALKQGTRLLWAYNDDRFPQNGVATIWIITEADWSATTILFPDEY